MLSVAVPVVGHPIAADHARPGVQGLERRRDVPVSYAHVFCAYLVPFDLHVTAVALLRAHEPRVQIVDVLAQVAAEALRLAVDGQLKFVPGSVRGSEKEGEVTVPPQPHANIYCSLYEGMVTRGAPPPAVPGLPRESIRWASTPSMGWPALQSPSSTCNLGRVGRRAGRLRGACWANISLWAPQQPYDCHSAHDHSGLQ